MSTNCMMSEALISVVVPAYNAERYLRRTLGSLTVQTHANLQIIVVDDGSSDGTLAIARDAASSDARIKVLHQDNAGVTAARLNGVAHATGEWIGFADADDIVEPNMYEVLLRNAIEYGAEISHCACMYRFPSGRTMPSDDADGQTVVQDNIEGLKGLLEGAFEPSLWSKLCSNNLLHNLLHNDLMDKTIRENEDLLMNYYLFREAKLSVRCGLPLYNYMVNQTSATQTNNETLKAEDALKVRKLILDDACLPPMLHETAYCGYMARLVSLVERPSNTFASKASYSGYRKELKREIGSPNFKLLGGRLRMQAKGVNAWPVGYRCFHRVYSRATGGYRKYSD